jgi:beta-mannosidase
MDVAPNADAHGCVHEWRVWNELDYARYRDRTPRFVAEFGWQAPPTWATIRAAISDDPLTPTSPGMIHHQKAADGNAKLERGLTDHFDRPAEFDSWLWAMQLNQARAVRSGVEHFRSLRGTCMGTVWWQLNDCWPVTSWALVDGGGRLKPAWFALRDAYRPQLLTIQPRGDTLTLFAVNDADDEWSVDATIGRWGLDGRLFGETGFKLTVGPRSIESAAVPAALAQPADPAGEVLRAVADRSAAWWWFAPDRRLRYPPAEVAIVHRDRVDPATVEVEVQAATLVRDLSVMVDRADRSLSVDRQLVTLLPGESATFAVTTSTGGDVEAMFGSAEPEPPLWRCANDLVTVPPSG